MINLTRFLRRESRRPIEDFTHRLKVGVLGAVCVMVGVGAYPKTDRELAVERFRAASESAVQWVGHKLHEGAK